MTLGTFLVLCLNAPLLANSPTIVNGGELATINHNTLLPYIIDDNCDTDYNLTGVCGKDEMLGIIYEKYPENAKLLACMLKKESSYGTDLIGDHGLAIGPYQIHIDKHDVSYWCAMNFRCSLDFVAQKLNEGKGYLWTAYRKCI